MNKEDTYEQINQLQLIEQNMQTILAQRQNLQAKILEIESALKEIEPVEQAYKIIGNIMVLTKKKELADELNSKKEIMELRIKALEKQEQKFKERASIIQKEVLGKIKEEDDKNGQGA